MTKQQLLRPFEGNSDLRLLMAKLLDRRQQAEQRSVLMASPFLTLEEQEQARNLLARMPPVSHAFFGGFSQAQRKVCVFLPPWMEEAQILENQSPLCALELQVPSMAKLSHRDYLGALMALGISREKFGDILCHPTGAQIVLFPEQAQMLRAQWHKVGRCPITVKDLPLTALVPPEESIHVLEKTVSSLRLDCVLGAGFALSRSQACERIAQGLVFCNHRLCDKGTKLLQEGDDISCRGLGKIVLKAVGGLSKKGRIIITLERYE